MTLASPRGCGSGQRFPSGTSSKYSTPHASPIASENFSLHTGTLLSSTRYTSGGDGGGLPVAGTNPELVGNISSSPLSLATSHPVAQADTNRSKPDTNNQLGLRFVAKIRSSEHRFTNHMDSLPND